MISRTHKIRMYPNHNQERVLRNTIGASRYAFNWALGTWEKWYQEFKEGKREDKPSAYKLCKLWTQEKPDWSNETGSVSHRRAILDVGTAFTNFWNKRAGRPKFKKKGQKDSFYVPNTHGKIVGKRIHIPKAGKIKLAEELRFEGKIESYTVSTYAGKWFVSVSVTTEDTRVSNESVVGVDVGKSKPAVASDGEALILPVEKLRRLEKFLKRSQRKVSRKEKGSNNRKKALQKKQRIQETINNVRSDSIHKFTSKVTKSHGTVVVETLNLKGMQKTGIKNVRKANHRSCMSEVLRQLKYKTSKVVEAPWNYPSSQICSCCGNKQKLKISQRTYDCPNCDLVMDRDLNAARNLKNYLGMVSPEVTSVEIGVPSSLS